MSLKFKCPDVDLSGISTECNCNYLPQPVKTMYIRRKKNGQIQVKINKEKWINATLNGNVLSYYR